MADGSFQIVEFIEQLDSAVKAHTLCGFSRWFAANKTRFDDLSPQKAAKLEAVHQSMHDAIRSICTAILAGQPGSRSDVESFEQAQSELIEVMAQFKTLFLINAARYDTLTGLRLRAGIESEFVQLQKVCRRNSSQLYAVIIDVDHFKQINDCYGHSVGDIALRHLADTLKDIVRPDEPLIRWGGEEFLLLIQCPAREAAATVADRIVELVRNAPVPRLQGAPIVMTVTVGLSRVAHNETMGSAVERADQALYAGKAAGRDRYVMASD